MAIRDEARKIATHFRPTKVHLFLATPAGLALLLGHLWDRMPDTQTYEDLASRGYQPAFLIPN
jgi:SMODS-associated and fused to various effectors sensor domain